MRDALDEMQTSEANGGARPAGYVPAPAVDPVAAANRPRARRKSDTAEDVDAELAALRACALALAALDEAARARVLLYLTRRYDPAPAPTVTAETLFGPSFRCGVNDTGPSE